ncbi:ComEA family DNA-binding protein [Pseudonocardiaceae bacterium YIM PH 21723]|nr:ComEA family DNA-binding protein [Pseudonocardiaceae bacterium YIM PH 21723]
MRAIANPPESTRQPTRAQWFLRRSWSRFTDRWFPAGMRWDPGPRGVLCLIVIGLLACVGIAFAVWSPGRPAEPVPVLAAATSAPAARPQVVVSVVGRVHRPGLVSVVENARVADVLSAAGGPLPDTDLTGLNLARRIADGEQVVVGVPAATPAGSATGRVNLNTATAEELDVLPGVGKATAKRIIDWRTKHGRFTSVDQLTQVGGVGRQRLDALREQVSV